MRVISLTSIPSRFAYLGPTLECLAGQGADEVRLYIPLRYGRFPDWDGILPDVPNGVHVMRCGDDLGPATKILPACRDLQGQDAQILFCDDDCVVPKGWAKRLFDLQTRRPEEAIAVYVRPVESYISNSVQAKGRRAWQLPIEYDVPFRASRLLSKIFGTRTLLRRPFVIPGYGEILFGVGGVVIRPEFFDDRAYDIPDIARPVDDVWLSANLARNGVAIYCPWLFAQPYAQESSRIDALVDLTIQSRTRFELNCVAARHCKEMFGIWK